MAIYLKNNSPWEQFGNLLGTLGGRRLNEIDAANKAKEYATNSYGGYEVPNDKPSLFKAALNDTPPVSMEDITMQMMGRSKPTTLADVQTQNPNAMPNRDELRKKTQQGMGANYVAFVKSGMSPAEARQAVVQKQQQDEQQQYSAAVNDYDLNVLAPMREQIMNKAMYTTDAKGNQIVAPYDPNALKALAPDVARLNYMASKVGLQGIDMNALSNQIASNKPNYKFQTQGNGHYTRTDDMGNVVDMGNYGQRKIQFAPNSDGIISDQAGNYKSIGNFSPYQMQKLGDAGINFNPGTGRFEVIGNFPTNNGSNSQNSQQLRSLVSLHNAWVKSNFGEDESKSPYYGQLQSLLNGGSATQDTGTDRVGERINELRQNGWSPEEIKADLKRNGLERYESWVW